MQVGINCSDLHSSPTHQTCSFPLSIYYLNKNSISTPFDYIEVKQGKGVIANPDSSISTIGVVCNSDNLVDIIASSGDRFRHRTICHDVRSVTYSYYVVHVHVHPLLAMSIFNLQLTRLLRRTCDHFLWVDDHVTIAEKRSLVNLERELRRLRSTPLTTSVTLRICRKIELVFKGQVQDWTRGEVVGMTLFMITLVMYNVHFTVRI